MVQRIEGQQNNLTVEMFDLLPVRSAPCRCKESTGLSDRVRTVMLCANRVLGETGLSRKIATFYKEFLVEEILGRIEEIDQQLSLNTLSVEVPELHTRPTNHGESLIAELHKELVLYMKYYSEDMTVLKRIFILFKNVANDNASMRPAIVEHALASLLAVTKRHPKEFSLLLVILLRNLLSPHREEELLNPSCGQMDSITSTSAWKNSAVDMVLDANCKDLILRTADCERKGSMVIVGCDRLIAFFSGNLSERTSLKHNVLAMDFIVARLRFNASRVQACLRDPAVERYRMRG